MPADLAAWSPPLDPLEAAYFEFPGASQRGVLGARWEAAGPAAMAAHPHETVGYGPVEPYALDLFLPQDRPDPAILVFFHGGYWQRRSRRDFAWIAPAFLGQGVGVAMMGYPLAPAARLEEIVQAARAGLDALVRARPAARLLLAGHSAGGHLVAMLAGAAPPKAVVGCLPISGVFELTPLLGTSVNDALGLDRARARSLSPRLLEPPRMPVLAAVGSLESDEFRRQSRDYASYVGVSGTDAGSLEVSGRNHFDVLDAFASPTSPLFRSALGMLAA